MNKADWWESEMKRPMMMVTVSVAAQVLVLGILLAEEKASQVKTGVVKKVDTSAGQVVVLVARELTFTVMESTRIVRGDEAQQLADLRVGAKVTVEYTRKGDTRTAKKIAIRAGDVVGRPAAKEVGPQIKPGGTFTIRFPDMPPTLADLLDHNGVKPMMTVSLPANYDPARKHPLLIFLNGGTGGTGGNASIARKLTEDKDFICVGVPLFKEKVDAPTPDNGLSRILIRNPDCRYAWPFYREMLAKLEELVPNIDPAHRILGGVSNGAHATSGLIDESDGEVARRFSAFFFVEGGGKLERYELLKGKPFLMVYGSDKSQRRAREIFEAAKAAGSKATLYGMNDVGHAFPESEFPAVRAWLRGPAME